MNKEKPLSIIEAELYEVLASKKRTHNCKMRLNEEWISGNGAITFGEEDIFTLVHRDTKYEWEFLHERVRGTVGIPHRIAKEMQIIGYEPTLNDVLLGLGKTEYGHGAQCDTDGLIVAKMYKDDVLITKWRVLYNISKSFDNQTEETKRKLHKLICEK